MLIPNDALTETIHLMRAVREAREALDASKDEHAVVKRQLKAVAERSATLSDVYSNAVAALAAHARSFSFK